MRLSLEERRLQSGAAGEGARWALDLLARTGEYFGAEDLVPVTTAQIVADVEVMGEAGLELVRWLAETETHFAVPTFTAIQFCDPFYSALLGQELALVQSQLRVNRWLDRMGAMVLNTNIPHQTLYQPHLGEHVSLTETGGVCYANGVFGARSNYEAGALSLAAAICGRVPRHGFHLPERRQGTVEVRLETELASTADWGALGGWTGLLCGSAWEVPMISGVSVAPSSDQLKHLTSALASFGSLAMFGIEGFTPEAREPGAGFVPGGPRLSARFGEAELASLYERYEAEGEPADLVVFSGPHLSIEEVRRLALLLKDRRINPGCDLILTVDRPVLAWAERLGFAAAIREAGGLILEGVAFFVMGVDRLLAKNGWRTIVTSSAKQCNVIGAFDCRPVLRSPERCIECALSGRVVPRA